MCMCCGSHDAHEASSDQAHRDHDHETPEAAGMQRLREEIGGANSAMRSGGWPRSALEIAKARYALGEITKAEFEELIADLA